MFTLDSTWTMVGGSNVYYRKAGGKLELTRLSPAIIAVIVLIVFSSLIELIPVFMHAPIVAIVVLIIFVLPPACSIPWTSCRNYLIADTSSGALQILKKNVSQRVIYRKDFNLNLVKDIIIRVDSGRSTNYALLLRLKNRNEIELHKSFYLSEERALQDLLQLHIKDVVPSKVQIQCDGVMIPIEQHPSESRAREPAPRVASPAPALTCAIDHSEIEGVVYACPACHALLCSACMKVYLTRSLGCPQCGRIVRPSEASNETRLLEIVDEQDDTRKNANNSGVDA